MPALGHVCFLHLRQNLNHISGRKDGQYHPNWEHVTFLTPQPKPIKMTGWYWFQNTTCAKNWNTVRFRKAATSIYVISLNNIATMILPTYLSARSIPIYYCRSWATTTPLSIPWDAWKQGDAWNKWKDNDMLALICTCNDWKHWRSDIWYGKHS